MTDAGPHRSTIEIDLRALRGNVRRLRAEIGDSALWAVVKANGYGHGAALVAAAALEEGAAALCTVTVEEALELREAFPESRLIVLGPWHDGQLAAARAARLELTSVDGRVPEGIAVHLKLDTGMGRWGARSPGEVPRGVVGLMSHFATADDDLDVARLQLRRFLDLAAAHPELPQSIANSAGALRLPEARLDACRIGIAMYGLSPFGVAPVGHGLEPVLRWTSFLAQVKRLESGESTGYGRRFVAATPTWVGLVPVGYADGFRRGLTGTEVAVAGERRPVVGTVSMDCFAVTLERELPVGTPVTLVGEGITVEEHAARLDTIPYEFTTGLAFSPTRCRRVAIGA
ncbi:MAG: alanine racemase [Actinobacteria bacterium]|nr:alanine racemase [Actinomycetota bacterium]